VLRRARRVHHHHRAIPTVPAAAAAAVYSTCGASHHSHMTQRSTQCGGGRPDDSTTCASGVNTMSAAQTVETVMKTHLDHDVPARHVAAAHAPLRVVAHAQKGRVPRRPKVLGGALSTAAATKAEKSKVVVKATWAQAGRGQGRRTCMRSR